MHPKYFTILHIDYRTLFWPPQDSIDDVLVLVLPPGVLNLSPSRVTRRCAKFAKTTKEKIESFQD